jgi:uncharacterized protein YfaP (DUF2135 family)
LRYYISSAAACQEGILIFQLHGTGPAQKEIPAPFQGRVFLPYVAYSSTIASVGQFAAQAPQSTQVSASMTYWVSPWEIASTGQFSAQVPQLTQASVIL